MQGKPEDPRRTVLISAFTAFFVGLLAFLAQPAGAQSSWHSSGLTGSPRIQWNSNYGYCGETSLITAGLRFGQYTSQWMARSLASPGISQTSANSQLLLGTNDQSAARKMRLNAQPGPTSGSFTTFITWVRNRFMHGDVVMVGMQNNTRMLGEFGPGDQSYDHIVPVYGYESAQELLSGRPAEETDVLTIADNGLRTIGKQTPMLYSYEVKDIQRTRAEANAAGGPVYSFSMQGPWYALAVSGVLDPDDQALPIAVTVNRNSEGLQNQPVLQAPPASSPIKLTVSVTRPPGGSAAVLYQYNDFAKVPTGDFNAQAHLASRKWSIPPGEGPFIFRLSARSSDTRVFRASAA
ncbi:MAG: hypothetical protein PHN51_07675 [Candidatus Nanopelagicales bacterium]|nr:hypothetical protein [Candidatus Nanopelagicales bacterium]